MLISTYIFGYQFYLAEIHMKVHFESGIILCSQLYQYVDYRQKLRVMYSLHVDSELKLFKNP